MSGWQEMEEIDSDIENEKRKEQKYLSSHVVHIKTGNVYEILYEDIINATNAQDGQEMIMYKNKDGMIFVREKKEFFEKFRKLVCENDD